MSYTKYTFPAKEQDAKDILIAVLSDIDQLGFEEGDDNVSVYVQEPFDEAVIMDVAKQFDTSFEKETYEDQNWNAVWESNYDPVIVPGFCTVRAHFHDIPVDTPYEILITPKMSFGTGHHATTKMMMMQMKDIDFNGRSVLDFGCGTGILAILAGKLGAAAVLGIDNDEWSETNANENIGLNDAEKVDIRLGSLEITNDVYDIILANINRNILLQYMNDFPARLQKGGTLLLSGILPEDASVIDEAAIAAGFSRAAELEVNNWKCLRYKFV